MERDDERPDPDALLAQVKAEEQRAKRARLKIFFGASPGVGKTYTMLEAARREKQQGQDIPRCCVASPGLPRRGVEPRGVNVAEFGGAPALARKPQLVLVDELAHT